MQEVGGSIPPSSTRIQGTTLKNEDEMHKTGRFAVFAGIALIASGLIIGFGVMFTKADSDAVNWLGLVPLGFVILLAGTVITQLTRPNDDN